MYKVIKENYVTDDSSIGIAMVLWKIVYLTGSYIKGGL